MRNLPTIFISYNQKSGFEQTLAVRLHTIGAVHGFKMLLPDRYENSELVSAETRGRIFQSDYFILFSTSGIDKYVKEEINIAYNHLQDKSKIIVIYDSQKGKTLRNTEHCTEVYINSRTQSTQQVLNQIMGALKMKEQVQQNVKKPAEPGEVLGGILLAGLGLLLLGSLLEGGANK